MLLEQHRSGCSGSADVGDGSDSQPFPLPPAWRPSPQHAQARPRRDRPQLPRCGHCLPLPGRPIRRLPRPRGHRRARSRSESAATRRDRRRHRPRLQRRSLLHLLQHRLAATVAVRIYGQTWRAVAGLGRPTPAPSSPSAREAGSLQLAAASAGPSPLKSPER